MTRTKLDIPRNVQNLVKGFSRKDKGRALGKVVFAVGADIEKYPPAGSGNRAPAPFYIRGRGTQLSGGRNLNNSQRMSVKWNQSIAIDGERATIENTASYSPFVIGRFQARFHAQRGWVNVPDYVEENASRLGEIYFDELLKGKVP